MHAKSDSEVTSVEASSPPRSPRRPLYFVQSPSRDSHDGDSKISFQSTPILSPIGSPLHPAFGSRSRDSSQTLSSAGGGGGGGRGKHGSRKILPQPNQDKGHSEKSSKGWATCTVIEEEPEFRGSSKASQIYTFLLILFSCLVFLALFILIFWLVCRPSPPHMAVKNVVFHNFYMGEGTDFTGVPTKMVSLNCSVQLNFYNPSKFFGVHVNPVAVALDFSELNIATGQLNGYFQEKRSRKVVSVVVQAVKVPIYGAAAGLSSIYESNQGIPLQMSATLHSRYYVVGKMVKPKFISHVSCNLNVDANTMALLTSLRSSCTYNPPN